MTYCAKCGEPFPPGHGACAKCFPDVGIAEMIAPTPDAYMRACRALHWRTAQLKAHGIEPVTITEAMPQYPPDDHPWELPSPSDHEIAIGEHAFGAGFDACHRMIGRKLSKAAARALAWSEYTPPPHLLGGGDA